MFTAAESYENQYGRWSKLLASQFVEFVGVKDGESALDVGCGTGSLAFTIASMRRLTKVVGVDPSSAFIDFARSRNSDPRVSFDVGDAERLPFPDASFDRCLSLLMITFIPNVPNGVREMRRVTRPGGVVATCNWDNQGGMEVQRFFWDAVVALDPAAESRHQRNRPLGTAANLSDLWSVSGFLSVEVKDLNIPLEFPSFDDLWIPLTKNQGPVGAYLATISQERQDELRDKVRRDILGSRPDGPFNLKAKAWAVKGTVP
jgi:ubiquinone/menaquinone biosynthesis C-methylase UbiE